MAWLVVGYAHLLDKQYDAAVPALQTARLHAGDLGDYADLFLAQALNGSGESMTAAAALADFDKKYPDSVLQRDAALLRAYAPQIVYAPSRIDFHPEHWRVAHALAQALGDDAGYALRVYQVQVPLTPVLTNCVADVSCVNEACARAFEAYASQRASITRCWRMRRYGASVYGYMRHAEEFWQMSARAYRRLHQAEPHRWRSRSFRALRAHALGDPLAYASGRRERRRLAHASGA